MNTSKEKLPENKEGKKEQKIEPLNLDTPDLTPRERRLLEGVLRGPAAEKLVKNQIDRMFEEDLSLRKAAAELLPLKKGEEVPEEYVSSSKVFNQKTPVEKLKQFSESLTLFTLPQEFRTSPKKFELYLAWLDDADRIYRNQSITFESLSPNDQKDATNTIQGVRTILAELKNKTEPMDITVLNMVNAINSMIRILQKLGMPKSQLTRSNFNIWLNAKRKIQGA